MELIVFTESAIKLLFEQFVDDCHHPKEDDYLFRLLRQRSPEAAALLDRMITQQAYQISFNEICYGLGFLFLALIFVLWLAKAPFHKTAERQGPSAEATGAH